jgi:hypothetical protein
MLDIPRRLHQRGDCNRAKFVTLEKKDVCETAWYKIMGISRSTYMSYKQENKRGCKILPHRNKGSQKKRAPTIQAESNIQFLIEQCVDVMPHQMKGIGDGR